MFTVGRGQKIMFFATKRIILLVRMTSKMTTLLVLIFNIVFIVLLFWDGCESDKSHIYGIC
jgi:hypothetical protein